MGYNMLFHLLVNGYIGVISYLVTFYLLPGTSKWAVFLGFPCPESRSDARTDENGRTLSFRNWLFSDKYFFFLGRVLLFLKEYILPFQTAFFSYKYCLLKRRPSNAKQKQFPYLPFYFLSNIPSCRETHPLCNQNHENAKKHETRGNTEQKVWFIMIFLFLFSASRKRQRFSRFYWLHRFRQVAALFLACGWGPMKVFQFAGSDITVFALNGWLLVDQKNSWSPPFSKNDSQFGGRRKIVTPKCFDSTYWDNFMQCSTKMQKCSMKAFVPKNLSNDLKENHPYFLLPIETSHDL